MINFLTILATVKDFSQCLTDSRLFDPRQGNAQSLARRTTVALLLSIVATFAAPGTAIAQATGGSISGTVTREGGGTMPGVRVSLSDVAKAVAREGTSDADGIYNLPALPPAVYEITVSSAGFITQTWTAIIIGVGTERVINIVMRPGDPKTVIRTTAPPAPVSQASACCGGNVDASTV